MFSTSLIQIIASCTLLSSVYGRAIVPPTAGKRGIAWPWSNGAGNLDPAKFQGSVSYIYNWETYQPTAGTGGLEFIGTQGCFDCEGSPISLLSQRASEQRWSTVFSANEPDIQGNSPQEAAAWYREWIAPLTARKALPSVSSSQDPGMGLSWLEQFMGYCSDCPHEYINLHWYGTNFEQFQNHIADAHARFPTETMVITEYALVAPANADQQNAFFKQAIPFLEQQPFVAMHFPFMATSPSLMDGGAASFVGTGSCLFNNDGSLSVVGQTVVA